MVCGLRAACGPKVPLSESQQIAPLVPAQSPRAALFGSNLIGETWSAGHCCSCDGEKVTASPDDWNGYNPEAVSEPVVNPTESQCKTWCNAQIDYLRHEQGIDTTGAACSHTTAGDGSTHCTLLPYVKQACWTGQGTGSGVADKCLVPNQEDQASFKCLPGTKFYTELPVVDAVLGDNNLASCDQIPLPGIEDAATCEAAGDQLGWHFESVVSWSGRPNGCIKGRDPFLFFNTTSNPGTDADFAPVCQKA